MNQPRAGRAPNQGISTRIRALLLLRLAPAPIHIPIRLALPRTASWAERAPL